MAFFSATPWSLPDGSHLWFGDSLPADWCGGAIRAGDYLLVTGNPSGPSLYLCSASSSTAITWGPKGGSQSMIVSKGADYTLDKVNDEVVILTSNNTITLPAANTVAKGKRYTVKRLGAGNGALAGAIDGGATSAAFGTDKAAITVVSDGTSWYMINTTGTVTIS